MTVNTQELLAENQRLKAQLQELIDLAKGAPLSSNVCMCGASMDEHPDYDHAAVDVWDYAFSAFLEKHNLENGVQGSEKTKLAYTDPESPNPKVDNRLHTVSGLRAGEAYNDLCRMISGRFPDCRIQEEAPKAHEFFMAFFCQPTNN